MPKFIYILFLGILISMSSCRKDFDTVPSSGNLQFSKDTVYLDTVFTNIGSSTYTLKVYNRSNKDIAIPTIKLKNANSKYRMMVDGMTGEDKDGNGIGDGKSFNNVELLAKDSLYIFIETTASISDANPTDFLYTDEIQFDSGSNLQKVNLVTLIQDAIFLYPQKFENGTKESLLLGVDKDNLEVRINGFELNENDPINGNEFHFTNKKPYVIYGYAGVPEGKILKIDAGARVHFHSESGLIVQPKAQLRINGTASPNPDKPQENEVIFEGDRLEPEFSDVPGQWGVVWLRDGSTSFVNHLTLKNASLGFLMQKSDLTITNSQIYNSSNYGILARVSTILGENVAINYAGQAGLACTIGGDYSFTHCTFNNNWNSSKQLSVYISNFEKNEDESITVSNLDRATFNNCIIYGSNNVELFLDKVDSASFNSSFENCLIKFNDRGTGIANDEIYNFIRNQESGNIKNKEPKFYNVDQNKLNIDETSSAFEKGNAKYRIPTDILGITRSLIPDIGAYQSAAFPK
ncbi:right-handed parallel beta-helix repeat-containing protein [Flavobacterium myungsuense]|uniref:Right-handed parallel beta-helix repeat-containing protein n=2 Tax=Flavobacterium myungsuense TaxID=651823 RepID=A0ABW3J494_9FLAO